MLKQFKTFFPTLNEDSWKEVLSQKYFDQAEMPYQLKVENNSSYGQNCHFCDNYNCTKNCPLPYTSKMTILDMLHKVGVEDNSSFYQKDGKSDLILNLVLNREFDFSLIRHLSGVKEGKRVNQQDGVDEENANKDITISDCFNEFSKPEILDEDNLWYCNKCKEHVQATKQLEIYRAPPILVVSLKRFKTSRSSSRYGGYLGMMGGMGNNQKIDLQVDFPLEGLDISKEVLGNINEDGSFKEQLIYDCYAVSNHYGNMGFGHYTAYAKNPIDHKWYEFDDSKVTRIRTDQVENIVTNAAYNLFYRKRDWHAKNMADGIDFEALAQHPDMAYVEGNKK